MLSIYDEETGCASERGTNQRIIIFAIFSKAYLSINHIMVWEDC